MTLTSTIVQRLAGFLTGLPVLPVLAAVGVLAAGLGGYRVGVRTTLADWQAAELKAVAAARGIEEARGRRQAEIQNALQRDRDRITADLDDAVRRLRDTRRERLPEAARTACAGTTGSELSREDGEFLIREAARAETLRKALEACYAADDALRPNSATSR